MGRPKKQQIEEIVTEEELENVLNEIPNSIIENDRSQEEKIPTETDPEWTQYVLDQLTENEKINNKYPKVDGLRRFVELRYGIESSLTDVIQAPNESNGKAVVKHRIYVKYPRYFTDGVADASMSNSGYPYNKYLTAIAETRAEGRALRRLLKLQTVTAEEFQTTDTMTFISSDEDKINDTQINFIDIMCSNTERGMNINVQKMVQNMFGTQYNNIKNLSHSQAASLAEMLSNFQQHPSDILDSIKGYDSNWRINNESNL